MIGCGHLEQGEWLHKYFTTGALVEPDEAEIIDRWFAHMGEVTARLAPGDDPCVIH